jgi:phosphate transport system substrate-binding protein
LSLDKHDDAFDANAENSYSGDYPLTRFLYVYINKNPVQKLDPLRGEFIKYVLSKQGQMIVIKDGYYPVSNSIVAEDLGVLGLY